MRYMLAMSEGGDYFVIPADRQDDFEEWDYNGGGDPWPEGVQSVGGALCLVTFSDPVID